MLRKALENDEEIGFLREDERFQKLIKGLAEKGENESTIQIKTVEHRVPKCYNSGYVKKERGKK